MSHGPEFSPPQFHRISAFLFFELWPGVNERLPKDRSHLERLSMLILGLAVCDYTAFPNRRDERTKQDALNSFDRDYDLSLEIATETLKKKEHWFSRKVDVIAKNSESSGIELWSLILTRSDRKSGGDYWGSVEFQEFFERSFALRISTAEETERFRNALKNKRRLIRKAEKKHRTIFEDLIIECAVEAETLSAGRERAKTMRDWLLQDRPKHIGQYMEAVIESHSNVMKSMTALLHASASHHRNRFRSSLGLQILPSPSVEKWMNREDL